jgi:putative ABC transport system ATP-binding protein
LKAISRLSIESSITLTSPLPANSNLGAPYIRLCQLVKAYKTSAGEYLALKGLNLTVNQGEFVGIVGKSGAGKSTLINMITGVDRLTAGSVQVANVSVHDLNENDRALWRGLTMGIIYQYFQLMPTLTLLDNILLPMDLCGTFQGRESVDWGMSLLERVDLQAHAFKLPAAISGGQQQRVAIARALVNDPPIVIADEPTGRLDNTTAETVVQIFEELVQQGKTVVIATHDHSLVTHVSHVIHIQDGEFIDEPAG